MITIYRYERGRKRLPDYKVMNYALAAQVANAVDLLIAAQRKGEEGAMEEDDFFETTSREARRTGGWWWG